MTISHDFYINKMTVMAITKKYKISYKEANMAIDADKMKYLTPNYGNIQYTSVTILGSKTEPYHKNEEDYGKETQYSYYKGFI